MNADGSDTVQLTTDASNSAYPSWSPDGSRILFESDRGDGNANIFVMNVDGTNVVQLTGQ
jgi:TolB protein